MTPFVLAGSLTQSLAIPLGEGKSYASNSFKMNIRVLICVFLMLLFGGGFAVAENSEPLTVTGKIYEVNPSSNPDPLLVDYTARGMLTLTNKQASKLKDVKVEAKYFGPQEQLLFTDTQTVNVDPKSTAEVYFLWTNPANKKIDHVEAVVSGKAAQAYKISTILRYNY